MHRSKCVITSELLYTDIYMLIQGCLRERLRLGEYTLSVTEMTFLEWLYSCQGQMAEAGITTLAREEAKFIPAKMMCNQHIEHAYECKHCKMNTTQNAQ